MKNKTISVQSVNASGVTLGDEEKQTMKVSWQELFDLVGTTGGFGGPNSPHMMPPGLFADLAREAMKQAEELRIRRISVAPHPLNRVCVETVAGADVGREMGVDWAHTQHAHNHQAAAEAAELAALYVAKNFTIIRS